MPPKPPLTHFLALPLYTITSAPLLNAALSRLADSALPAPEAVSSNSGVTGPAERLATGQSSPKDPQLSNFENDRSHVLSHNDQSKPPLLTTRENARSQTSAIPPGALRPASTLHLTLGVMSLRGQWRVDDAASFLANLDVRRILADVRSATFPSKQLGPPAMLDTAADSVESTTTTRPLGVTESATPPAPAPGAAPPTPLCVTLHGLHAMQAPQATTVLYAAPHDPSGRLVPLCEKLRAAFVSAGFVVPEDRALKLHATLVNTVYSKGGAGKREVSGSARGAEADRAVVEEGAEGIGGDNTEGGGELDREGSEARGAVRRIGQDRKKGRRKGKQRLEMDARQLMQRWHGEQWAEVMLEKVVICEMGAKEDSSGLVRYREIAEASLL